MAALALATFRSTSRSMVWVITGCRITSAPMAVTVRVVSGNQMS